MIIYALCVVFILIAFLGIYRERKKRTKFVNEWNINFELIYQITELTKENRKEIRNLIYNSNISQLDKVNKIEDNFESIIRGCDMLNNNLIKVFQDNANKNFKNIEVEIKQKIEEKTEK